MRWLPTLLVIAACAPSEVAVPGPLPGPAVSYDTTPAPVATEPPPTAPLGPIEAGELVLMAAQDTFYLWGGIGSDGNGPHPLDSDTIAPGATVDWLQIECVVDETGSRSTTRCNDQPRGAATGGAATAEASAKTLADRLDQCLELQPTAAPPSLLAALGAGLRRAGVGGERFFRAAREWHVPRPRSAGAALMLLSVRRRAFTDEIRETGCENPPPNVGCDPVAVKTGRQRVHEQTVVRLVGSSPRYDTLNPFGGSSPQLYRVRIEQRDGDRSKPHPQLAVDGSNRGIEGFYRAQRERLAALPAPTDDVRAAVLVNSAILSLRLGELARARQTLGELQALLDRVDRAQLGLDVTLPVLERILAGQWLVKDPCAP